LTARIRAVEVGRGGGGFATAGVEVEGGASSNISGGIELGTTWARASIPSGIFIPLSGLGSSMRSLSPVDIGLMNHSGPRRRCGRVLRAHAHFDATTSELFSPCSRSDL
jgi:hypothetical protein